MIKKTLFKAWDKITNEWYDDTNLLVVGLDGEITNCWNGELMEDYTDRIELLRVSDLKSKNGQELCEGQVVCWNDKKDIYTVEFGEFGVPNVEEQEYQDVAYGFYLKPQHDLKGIAPFNMTIPLNTKYAAEMTVLGHVRENPELLEVD